MTNLQIVGVGLIAAGVFSGLLFHRLTTFGRQRQAAPLLVTFVVFTLAGVVLFALRR